MKKLLIAGCLLWSGLAWGTDINTSRGYCTTPYNFQNIDEAIVAVLGNEVLFIEYPGILYTNPENNFFGNEDEMTLKAYNWPGTRIELTKTGTGLVNYQFSSPLSPFSASGVLVCVPATEAELETIFNGRF